MTFLTRECNFEESATAKIRLSIRDSDEVGLPLN
jgi:hypothetical protein